MRVSKETAVGVLACVNASQCVLVSSSSMCIAIQVVNVPSHRCCLYTANSSAKAVQRMPTG